ncbi:hypothetical protein [Chthonobacter rhizosphaerae]|uniref:hypothetical protein n=1 Tax=Chthonobacter rhizosphaerae TaxID=2735553 RepID=UPI0015EEAD14|nr:hypothetical protein [Chthonobacter rhizosphaerae]
MTGLQPDLVDLVGITDLEDRLRAGGGAAIREQVAARLAALRSEVVDLRRAGLPTADFQRSEPILAGLDAALEIIHAFPAFRGTSEPRD